MIGSEGVVVNLKKGGSLSSLAYDLQKQGILNYPKLIIAYSRLSNTGRSVKAGEYHLEVGLTPLMLLQKIERGDVKYYQLTLVEGWNLVQVLQSLKEHNKLKKLLSNIDKSSFSLSGFNSADLNKQLTSNLTAGSMEGLLFPDTYSYSSSTSDIDILKQAYKRLESVLQQEWSLRDNDLPYDNAYQALIMASLVEKETGDPSERAKIAGVFVRRLNKGMRLQTDPSVIYGLGPSFDGNLKSRHLKDGRNAFNTYRHHGLPPTPIALAGREAIRAALHPKQGGSLYFVAKGDGSHYFSSTLDEHRKAVQKYQVRQRRKNYTSAPKSDNNG